MSNKTITYPIWLFCIEISIPLGSYIFIIGSFYKYYFYTNLWGHHIFIYMFLMITTVVFLFFLFTLLTGTYYNKKEKAYIDYRKQINRRRRKGKYSSPLKYTIGLIVGFSFFLSALVMSGITAVKTKNEILMIVSVIFILGLLGFIRSIRNGSFYSLISKKKKKKDSISDNTNGTEVNPLEDGITLPDK